MHAGGSAPSDQKVCGASLACPAASRRKSADARRIRIIDYQPYLYKTGLFDRAWPQFRTPIETHWKAYVNGQMSREDAMKRIVSEVNTFKRGAP